MITIVLADDHRILRQGLRALLDEQTNFQVVGEADDGQEALMMVEKLRPDILVADMIMGGMTGIELTHQVKQRLPDTKVIILSMYDDTGYVHKALRAGAKAYVLKDSSAVELVTAIKKALSGKRYLSQRLSERAIDVYIKEMLPARFDINNSLVLTSREREILHYIARGFRNRDIASELSISPRTVEFHRNNIMKKLGLHSQQELFRYCALSGIIHG